MRVLKCLGISVLVTVVMGSCNQSNTEKQEGDESEQTPRTEENSMDAQATQSSDPYQQQQITEVSDKELQKFAVVIEQLQIINQETEQNMLSTVEEKGLEVQRFTEIRQAKQNPQQGIEFTQEEEEKYEEATQALQELYGQSQQKMEGKITEGGLTVHRYQEIAMAVQNDPDLQKKFQIIQQQTN